MGDDDQRHQALVCATIDAIEVRDLRVSYGDVHAVDGVDLTVHEGEVFALLGPNGAGKTTTIEVLEGFRSAQSGDIRVLGEAPRSADLDWRRQLGIVLQETAVEPYLTVREVLRRNQACYDDPLDIDATIERVGLGTKADARIRTLSGGQQRRLDVALGIIGRPRLLFLDEPTTGFDPGARRGAWDLVRSLREVGTTIVLTTHYMDEAQALTDRLAVVAHGRIVAEGTSADIGGRDHAAVRIRFALPAGVAASDLPAPAEEECPGQVIVLAEEPAAPLHELTGWLIEHGHPLDGLTVDRPTLEDVYLDLTTEESA